MTPKNGGKFELKLQVGGAESAEYQARLSTVEGTFDASALVGGAAPGRVDFGAWSSDAAAPPPAWLVADASAALKAAFRASRAEGRWPRRITRWRPEPSG